MNPSSSPMCITIITLLSSLTCSINSLSLGTFLPNSKKVSYKVHNQPECERRQILEIGRKVIVSTTASAAIAPRANAEPKEIVKVGQQETPPDGETPFKTLSNGVQIKDFRAGSSASTVQSGSKVELILKGRLLNLNGVIFYDTKSNDPNGFGEGTPLVFTVGDGTVLPGLESGLIGMNKGGIRRVIVPAELGYGKFPDLEPKPFTEMERRALDSVVKNPRRDATIMFDVKLERLR